MRRPLRAHEKPHLVACGRLLGSVRRASGMTQEQLALFAGLSRVQVARIELGMSRTRRSTLTRIAAALVAENPGLGSVERLTDDLVATAGPALAEESVYAERVARRRAARTDAAWRQDERTDELRVYRAINDVLGSEYWYWRPEDEKDEFRAGFWESFYERRADLMRQRQQAERLSHGRRAGRSDD